jgi:hypothetical protein
MNRVFEKDGVYGVILTQTELDIITSLIGSNTPATTGTVMWSKLKEYQTREYRHDWVSLPEDEIEKYKQELGAIGDEYVR